MATGSFTYDALRTRTLKEHIKNTENKSNAVSTAKTIPYLAI